MIQRIVWYSVLYGTAYCMVQCIVWYNVLYGTVYCMVECIVWYSVLYGTVYCMVQFIVCCVEQFCTLCKFFIFWFYCRFFCEAAILVMNLNFYLKFEFFPVL